MTTYKTQIELNERTDLPVIEAALEFFKHYDSRELLPIKYAFESIVRLAEHNIRKLNCPEYANEDVSEYIKKNEEKIRLAKFRLRFIDKFIEDFYSSL